MQLVAGNGRPSAAFRLMLFVVVAKRRGLEWPQALALVVTEGRIVGLLALNNPLRKSLYVKRMASRRLTLERQGGELKASPNSH